VNKILNNVVRDTGSPLRGNGIGIAICSSGNIVNGNIVHNNHGDGIVVGDIEPSPPIHVACEGNTFKHTTMDHMDQTTPATNTGNTITNNIVRGNDRYGIVVWSSTDAEPRFSEIGNSVVHNTVHDNGIGIAISPPKDPSPGSEATSPAERTYVEANSVHDNDIGIIEQGALTTCTGNNIRRNNDGNPPQGACASADNQLPYIRGR
jgi:hypothetical protein